MAFQKGAFFLPMRKPPARLPYRTRILSDVLPLVKPERIAGPAGRAEGSLRGRPKRGGAHVCGKGELGKRRKLFPQPGELKSRFCVTLCFASFETGSLPIQSYPSSLKVLARQEMLILF